MLNTWSMDARDEIKSRLSIEDVIGSYVELKRAGRNFKAFSPFSNEKTPSFIVSPDKQIWHDFSSGKGGDVFTFIMEVEGVDFREALEILARKAGVDLEQFENKNKSKSDVSKNRLYEILELSSKFYQVQFSKNKIALNYIFNRRKFTKETALKWQLGYSPNTGDALVKFLRKKGYNEKEIKLAGLSTARYADRDMFRGRLMIPLHDSQGRVIGYTARILEDDNNTAKYINTPQTPLYDKSRHVYGLHLAKEAIRQKNYSVLVEGNLDVISSHQAGIRQTVATAGTAMTPQHLKALSRLSPDVRLCFDADKAGINATERAIPIASKEKINLSIISLPAGQDPDDLIRKNPEEWIEIIEKPKYALDWLIEIYSNKLDLKTVPAKRQFSDIILPIIESLSDDVEKDHYINVVSGLLSVSSNSLNSKLNKVSGSNNVAPKKIIKFKPQEISRKTLDDLKLQNNFLSLMLSRKTLREFLDIVTSEMLFTEEAIELFDILKSSADIDIKADTDKFKKISDYVKIELLLYEELYESLDLNELHYEAARLQNRLIEAYVKSQKQLITRKLIDSDSISTQELLIKARNLDDLLKRVKGDSSK